MVFSSSLVRQGACLDALAEDGAHVPLAVLVTAGAVVVGLPGPRAGRPGAGGLSAFRGGCLTPVGGSFPARLRGGCPLAPALGCPLALVRRGGAAPGRLLLPRLRGLALPEVGPDGAGVGERVGVPLAAGAALDCGAPGGALGLPPGRARDLAPDGPLDQPHGVISPRGVVMRARHPTPQARAVPGVGWCRVTGRLRRQARCRPGTTHVVAVMTATTCVVPGRHRACLRKRPVTRHHPTPGTALACGVGCRALITTPRGEMTPWG